MRNPSHVSSPTYVVRPFGPAADPPSRDLTRLHAELLPTSPVVALGPRFMEGFYYRFLPLDGHVFGAVAYVDGEPAGFVTATEDSAGFMRAAVRRRAPRAAWSLAASLVTAPRGAQGLLEAMAIDSGRRAETTEPIGEMLSLGVRPPFRRVGFVRRTGINVAADLVGHAVRELAARGVPRVRAVVDADNVAVQVFLRALGWELVRGEVPGWRVPSREFEWRL